MTHRTRIALPIIAAGLVFILARAAGNATPKPPETPRGDAGTTYHGVTVADPYRWLEDPVDPRVEAWIEAQNAYTEKFLGSFADGPAIAKRVEELELTSTRRSEPRLVGSRLFYLRQTPPQPQPVLVVEGWPQGEARVLVDPNGDEGSTAITAYWPTPDGKRVAYGLAAGGGEATTIHVVDVASGDVLDDALPWAGGGTTPQALAWDADGRGMIYVRLPQPGTVPDAELQFGAALYHHVLGRPASEDTVVFGAGLSPIAEYVLMRSTSGTGAALVHFGDGASDSLYLEQADGSWKRALTPAAEVHTASGPEDGAAWDGDRLLVVSHQDAPRGKLLAIDPDGRQRELLPQGDWAMRGVFPIADGFLVTRVSGPDWRVEHYDAHGGLVRSLALPPSDIGIDAIASSRDAAQALISYSGWSLPNRWVRYDGSDGGLTTVFEVKPAADYSKVRSHRLTAVSKDGTRVPVTLLALEGVTPTGHVPTILYGYGGFGICTRPGFLGSNLAWLERGGVFARAYIRGGGEFGEAWHAAGMLGNKQNVFDDFYAAAEALVAAGWTDAAHLGILGGSNGGLLMGAELTQHPDAFRAVVSLVGIYDMLRVELFPNGRYNTSEYGTVAGETDFRWLHAYSPLHRVEPGTRYPAVLMLTGANDPRVAPWQSRKFAAALQAANGSDRPVLLLTRTNEGHGVTASFGQRVGNAAATLTFFARELEGRE